MAAFNVRPIDYSQNTISSIAEVILEKEHLPGTLVVLPSTKVCNALRYSILEKSKKKALLLPEIITTENLIEKLSERIPGLPQNVFPNHLRRLVLANKLQELDWTEKCNASIPGLASEIVDLFDELRMSQKQLSNNNIDDSRFQKDLQRVEDSLLLYKKHIPFDHIDRTIAVVKYLKNSNSKVLPVKELIVAGISGIKPLHVELFKELAKTTEETVLVVDELQNENHLGQLLLSGYDDKQSKLFPLYQSGKLVNALANKNSVTHNFTNELKNEAVNNILFKCSDPETESKFVAQQVIQYLDANRGSNKSVIVATADKPLAKRIFHNLEASGITTDDTGGVAVSSTKEGLLIWALLRAKITNQQNSELLELLTHPDVKFDSGAVLLFEKNIRKEKDSLSFTEVELIKQVDEVLSVLGDLDQKESWATHVSNLKKAWGLVMKKSVDLESGSKVSSIKKIGALLESLSDNSEILPPVTLSQFSYELGKLMNETTAQLHREQNLPVQITGLVEARMESSDLLILAGMNADTFPGKQSRPILLGTEWRNVSGLPTWEDSLSRDADLFMRLIHNGENLLVTWSAEKNGNPTLPSPFISRMTKTIKNSFELAEHTKTYRLSVPDIKAVEKSQALFLENAESIPVFEKPKEIISLSNSSIKKFRECPLKFLYENGFGLADAKELDQPIGNLEYGNWTHKIMEKAFKETDFGEQVLANDHEKAESTLRSVVNSLFSGVDQIESSTWEALFVASVPNIVKLELEHGKTHVNIDHEQQFNFKLSKFNKLGVDVPESVKNIKLCGKVDRIDKCLEDSTYSVYDYKSGAATSNKNIVSNKDLQLQIYALALVLGCFDKVGNGQIKSGGIYHLKKNSIQIKPEIEMSNEFLKEAAELIVEVAVKCSDFTANYRLLTEEEMQKHNEASICSYCHLRTICRIDEVKK